MAFLEKGDKDAGKIALKKVVRDYPRSNQAQIAQKKLSQLK
jgi:TolA-binding protein